MKEYTKTLGKHKRRHPVRHQDKRCQLSLAWWCMSVISALRGLRKEPRDFQPSQGYKLFVDLPELHS